MIMSQINKIEIGVFLLPPSEFSKTIDNISQAIFGHIINIDSKVEYKKNIPHLSLYQMSIPVYKLEMLDAELKTVFSDVSPIDVELEDTLKVSSGNIFWCIKDNIRLKSLENKILNSPIIDFRCGSPAQTKEIDIKILTSEQKLYLDQYGIFWIKNHYDPHFTIFYDINKYEDYCHGNIFRSIIIKSKKILLTEAAYGVLDYRGNVVKVLGNYHLNKEGRI